MKRKKYRHLTRDDRIKIEAYYNQNMSERQIAKILGFNQSTICREIKKGLYEHTNYDLSISIKYSYDKAQMITNLNVSKRGPKNLKVDFQKEYVKFIESKVVDENYSPQTALIEAKKEGFTFSICVRTFYNLIDMEFFERLSYRDLPTKRKRKKRKLKKMKRLRTDAPLITDRPDEIETRETFGHWEMDTVKGRKGITKGCLLVLSERKTRKEIVRYMKNQKAESVVKELNKLEKEYGDRFYSIFKTITVDNGVEFADYKGMIKSCLNQDNRTEIYYCHPYASWERGTNENQNRYIRRFLPKGYDFDGITIEQVQIIEEWINNYPRRMFDYKTPDELYAAELLNIA